MILFGNNNSPIKLTIIRNFTWEHTAANLFEFLKKKKFFDKLDWTRDGTWWPLNELRSFLFEPKDDASWFYFIK